ncbi:MULTISPECIES: hypothetical protein [unclassified Micromonospora]|uniref:hypothetical protein n=1 Tax=unclassified Micromonospora TaxID=2617518 RepID=UPI003A8360BD
MAATVNPLAAALSGKDPERVLADHRDRRTGDHGEDRQGEQPAGGALDADRDEDATFETAEQQRKEERAEPGTPFVVRGERYDVGDR